MPAEEQEIVTPSQFESMISDSLSQASTPDHEPQADPETVPDDPEEPDSSVADKDELSGDEQTDKPKIEAKAEEPETKEEEKTTEEKLFEVKVDGNKEKVTEEELKKSYERFKASTQRFQAASEKEKTAEATIARAEQIEQNAKNTFKALLSNPQAILDVIGGNAPDTLHRAFEIYAKRHVSDQELKEKDRDLYDATLEQRRREAEIKRQQQEIARQRKEVEDAQAKSKQDAESRSVQTTVDTYNGAVPSALKAAGVPDEMATSLLIKSALRDLVQSAWPQDLLLKDLPRLVDECAKELVKDPAIKAMIGKSEPAPQKGTKTKATVTVTSPEPGPSKDKFLTPNEFLRSLSSG